MSESRFYHITPEGKLILLESLDEALSATGSGGFIWLDYFRPTREELSLLIDPLGLHPLSVEDCFDENQIPKIDDYPGNAFLLFNTFSISQGVLTIGEADMFIGTDFLVTINSIDPGNRQIAGSIEHNLEVDPKSAQQGPAFLLHLILDRIVDQKFLVVEAIEDELDKTEEEILTDLPDFNPAALLHHRRDLLALRKSLFHEREVLIKICRKDCPFIPEKVLFLYRDLYDHLNIFFELIETSREIATSLMEIYLSMLNNQMAITGNRTNMTVRRLTFITTIFMPLTLLAGIFGMSEWSMMTRPENWRITYPAFLLVMVIIGIVSYYFLRRLENKSSGRDLPGIGEKFRE